MMGRQRRGMDKGSADRGATATETRSTSSHRPGQIVKPVRVGVAVLCLVVAVSISYKGYLETRVNSRFDKEKMVEKSGLEVPDRYWGSYRPGLYFGMKTRDPYSIVAGLMWYFPARQDGSGIRHWCEQGDNLHHYTWTEHDGRNFGHQEIDDGPYHLETSFVKRPGGHYGGDWTAQVTVVGRNSSQEDEVSLVFYVALDGKTDGWIMPKKGTDQSSITTISGKTTGLGSFKFVVVNQGQGTAGTSYLSTVTDGLHVLKETLVRGMRVAVDRKSQRRRLVLSGEDTTRPIREPNFVAIQVTTTLPADVAFVFESESFHDRPNTLTGSVYQNELNAHRTRFRERFESIYDLRAKGYSEGESTFAKSVLSNLIGGIGYFYGASRVQSSHTETPVPYWKAPLYTAVPSRSFFPRGFLWDEGFHGLLISTWDLEIELDIMNHWFDLMNVEGWIPREQILGSEALAKVPEEFVTQHNANANPPAFFLTLDFILKRYGDELERNGNLRFLDALYPRLQAWFDWFNSSQAGALPGTYRWRGRDPNAVRELNPKTLTSGLDDYPRASHPDGLERHLDLRCWMALASSTLWRASHALGRDPLSYQQTYDYLVEPKLLRKLHWSERTRRFVDYGLHTDSVALKKRHTTSQCGKGGPPPNHLENEEKIRITLKEPSHRLVDSMFGYVSLFPFLLEQLDPDSPELGAILEDLEDPRLLWTNYGLRSLSKTSPLYMKRNTEHDPPYWRGPIWININYLAVKALHRYARGDGPHSTKAGELYTKLRRNLVGNIYREYKRTGYVWEQYNDETGHGQGSRPFTGWSALVLLLMGEIY